MTDSTRGDDQARGDRSSTVVKLIRQLDAAKEDDEFILIIRRIQSRLRELKSDFRDLAEIIEKYELGKFQEIDESFYKQAYVKGYATGGDDREKRLRDSGAIFAPAEGKDVTWQQAVLFCEQHTNRLTQWEQGLISDMVAQIQYKPDKPATDNQKLYIFKAYRRLRGKGRT